MKTIKFISIVVLAAVAVTISSCSKNAGFDGGATIKGKITLLSTGAPAPGAVVSIAFGATAATTSFNYSTVTDTAGNYAFDALNKGNYFVNASYTDYVQQGESYTFTSGGELINLGSNSSTATVNLALQ